MANVSASIGGAEPVFNYDEFLITSFPLDEFITRELHYTGTPKYRLSLYQSYYSDNYHLSRLVREDSLTVIGVNAKYDKELYQGSLFLSVTGEHSIGYDYFNIPHKEGLRINSFSLQNRLKLFDTGSRSFSIENRFDYLQHHKEDETVDLTGLANFSALNLQINDSLTRLSLTIPYHHNNQYGRIGINYFLEKGFSNDSYNINSYLVGVGASAIDTGSRSIFPSLFFRYNRQNKFLVRFRLEEEIISYRYEYYFSGKRELWSSKLPANEDFLRPLPRKEAELSAELITGNFFHELFLGYSRASEGYDYDWEIVDDVSKFSIIRRDKRKEQLRISFSPSYKETYLKGIFLLGDRTDFEPFLTLSSGTRIFLNPFNSVTADISYNYEETILSGKEKIDYASVDLRYCYSKIDHIKFEAGVYYSTLETTGMSFTDNFSVWLKLSYTKFKR